MVDRRFRHRVRLEPHSRPEVEILGCLGLSAPEFCPQEFPEQVVVSVPLPVAIKRDHKQVPGLHLFENGPGPLLTQDRIAEGPAHLVQDGCAGEERHLCARDPVEEFRAQVVAHVHVVAGEGEAGLAPLGTGIHRQRSDVQPGWPSLGSLQEITEARLVGLGSCAPQQRVGFHRPHGQVVGGDLQQSPLSTQPRRRQRHRGA